MGYPFGLVSLLVVRLVKNLYVSLGLLFALLLRLKGASRLDGPEEEDEEEKRRKRQMRETVTRAVRRRRGGMTEMRERREEKRGEEVRDRRAVEKEGRRVRRSFAETLQRAYDQLWRRKRERKDAPIPAFLLPSLPPCSASRLCLREQIFPIFLATFPAQATLTPRVPSVFLTGIAHLCMMMRKPVAPLLSLPFFRRRQRLRYTPVGGVDLLLQTGRRRGRKGGDGGGGGG